MTVLITRPIIDAQETADFLKKNGVETLIDPMMIIEGLNNSQSDIKTFEHIIFTSKNGIRAFIENFDDRSLTAWCVGDETARMAKEEGFHTVHSAQGTAQDLERLITDNLIPQPIIRVWRNGQDDTFSKYLADLGYGVQSLPLYNINPAPELSQATISAIKEKKIEHIIFYSPQTARVTIDNITKAGLTNACDSITAWCISKKTASALDPVIFKEIIIAKAPNEIDLLTPLIARTT